MHHEAEETSLEAQSQPLLGLLYPGNLLPGRPTRSVVSREDKYLVECTRVPAAALAITACMVVVKAQAVIKANSHK